MYTKFNKYNESLLPTYDESEQKIIAAKILDLDNSFSPIEAKNLAKSYNFLKADNGEDYDASAKEIIESELEARAERFNNPTLKKIVDAINSGKLKILRGGEKMFGKTKLSITDLVWARNYDDGFVIDVYENGNDHVGEIKVTSSTNWKPVITEAY